MSDPLAELSALEDCWCHACREEIGEPRMGMTLCPICGNKRCPKATHHAHQCSGSNASGQLGSAYGNPCPDLCCQRRYNNAVAERRAELQTELAKLRRRQL